MAIASVLILASAAAAAALTSVRGGPCLVRHNIAFSLSRSPSLSTQLRLRLLFKASALKCCSCCWGQLEKKAKRSSYLLCAVIKKEVKNSYTVPKTHFFLRLFFLPFRFCVWVEQISV